MAGPAKGKGSGMRVCLCVSPHWSAATACSPRGRSKNATQLDEQVRFRLQNQAFAGLRAHFAAWAKLADDAKEHARLRQTLQHWQKDPDLDALRDPAAVA